MYQLSEVILTAFETPAERIWLTIPTAMIAFGGIVSNSMSMFYFITRENELLGSRLIMMLNSLDLVGHN